MKQALQFGLLLAALAGARAETIDRIAVSVGNRVITTSDIDRQIRVAAFLSGTAPDFTPAARRKMAEHLVDQKLIQREIETTHYIVPDTSGIEAALRQFQTRYYRSPDDYRAALAAAGITDQDVRDELLRERTVTAFIEVRFQPAVQVTEQDIQDYFDKTVAPAARAANPGQAVTLEQYHDEIERTLTGRRADAEVENWLTQARRRNPVIFHDEVFR